MASNLQYTSAVVLIPPKSMWPKIQEIRKEHDRGFVRWMPHITLLYPFVKYSEFDSAYRTLTQAMESVKPFNVSLNSFKYFMHGQRSATLWLHPSHEDDDSSSSNSIHGPLCNLQAKLFSAMPQCDEQSNRDGGFVPHLSVGQWRSETAVSNAQKKYEIDWPKTINFKVNCIYMISRCGNDPFKVRKIIALNATNNNTTLIQSIKRKSGFIESAEPSLSTLFVAQLPDSITTNNLVKLIFTNVGITVASARLVKNRQNGRSKGFAFVELEEQFADHAISLLHHCKIDDKLISVQRKR